MEPIKFEDNIREKLQEREIQPSKNAWKKLNSQLNSDQQKRTNKSIWFAVAAGFVGIIIIASLLFKQEVTPLQITKDSVVEEINDFDKLDKEGKIVFSEKEIKEVSSKEQNLAEKTIKKEKLPIAKKSQLIQKNASDIAVNSDNSIKETSDPKDSEIKIIDNSSNTINNELFLDSKVEEVVAQVQALEKDKATVSIEEINALLLNAQREIQEQNITYIKNNKVDANALLNAVESELESSFRDKVFEALGDGYKKVRTAVVERNN